MRHMLIIGPRKVLTSCGIRICAHYPQSGKALPARDSAEPIDVSLSMDAVDCPRCLASVGLRPALSENDIAALCGGRKAAARIR